jgi:tetratricopeptide (TPR) repeat protein
MPNALRTDKALFRRPHWIVITIAFVLSSAMTLSWALGKAGALRRLLWLSSEVPASIPPESPEQIRRRTPVAEVAPTPLPSAEGLPLLGRVGEDEYGMPTQYVNGAALRSLLSHREYARLNSIFESLQREFELDGRKEYWPIDSADAFDSAEAELKGQLDGWVANTPKAFAPYLARGVHLLSAAWARRGDQYVRDTPEQNLAGMAATLPWALADVERALELAPKSVAARRMEIKILFAQSLKARALVALQRAIAVCPPCFQVRVAFMVHLRPRWGGSNRAMEAFANTVDQNDKKLRLLRGYVDWDRAVTLSESGDFEGALRAINRACSLGTHWEFLVERSEIDLQLDRADAAAEDAEAAWRARPGSRDARIRRIAANEALSRWQPAGRDLLAVLRTEPTSDFARRALPTIVKGLIYEGWESYKANRPEGALALFELASELDPHNGEVSQRKAFIIEGKSPGAQGEMPRQAVAQQGPSLDSLRYEVIRTPNDFGAHQRLDYSLAAQGKYEDIIPIWDDFIFRNPNEGRAYLERSGTYYHLHKLPEAKADAGKACELGISEGCAWAKRLATRM